MAILRDLSGRRFGKLVVLNWHSKRPHKRGHAQLWLVKCDCGTQKVIESGSLTCGRSRSCGCGIYARPSQLRHGHTRGGVISAEHNAWSSMLKRCEVKGNKAFRYYGGRGITVCDRWHTFENFLADMGHRPSPKHSLDRIDNDAGYSPENCRWATQDVQIANRRISLKDDGVPIAQLARDNGIPYQVVRQRFSRGLRGDELTKPIKART